MPDQIEDPAGRCESEGGNVSRFRRKMAPFRERFLHMLGRDDPPETVAASFALGVAISFTPLIGLHWVIALLLALILKLNKVDVLLGTLVVNPLTLPPVAWVAIHLGRLLLQARHEALTHLPWNQLFHRSFWEQAGPRMRAVNHVRPLSSIIGLCGEVWLSQIGSSPQ